MNYSENITLNKYAKEAEPELKARETALESAQSRFKTAMKGQKTSGLYLAIPITIIWTTTFAAFFSFVYLRVQSILGICGIIGSVILGLVMIIDDTFQASYVGRIQVELDQVDKAHKWIRSIRESIPEQEKKFMNTRSNGWNYGLGAVPSEPEMTARSETAVANMEQIKNGALHKIKNVMYFVMMIAITFAGSWYLFSMGAELLQGIIANTVGYLDGSTMNIIMWIALGVACLLEILAAKAAWSHCGCEVTNVTLAVSLAGPFIFVLLMVVGGIVAVVTVWAITIAVSIGAVVLTLFCCSASGDAL